MNDAVLVRRLQGIGDLLQDRQRFVERHSSAGDPVGKILPLDEFHDQRVAIRRLLEAVNDRDVRMIERREHLGFAPEARDTVRVARKRLRQDLDRDGAIEARIAGFVNLTHAARAQRGQDFERAEPGAGIQGQTVGLYGSVA